MGAINRRLGFTLVEVLIGASIIASSMVAIIFVFQRLARAAEENIHLTKAAFLLEEGLEAVRVMRDDAWANLATLNLDTDYYLLFTGATWATTTTNTLIDNLYQRQFSLSAVERDGSGEVVAAGGTVDPDTKLVTVEVAWSNRGATTTRALSAYLTNLFE